MNVDTSTSGDVASRAAAWTSEAVPKEEYAEIARSLISPDSPVGIDAKHTHVLILHALDRIEKKLTGHYAAAGTGETTSGLVIRRSVRRLLESSPAFQQLPPGRRADLAASMEPLVLQAGGGDGNAVDFPDFVADLLEGVFEAIVNASIEQMEAYTDLLEDATESADRFAKRVKGESETRQRRRLLAMMALLGLSRVGLRRGEVEARSIFRSDGRDED